MKSNIFITILFLLLAEQLFSQNKKKYEVNYYPDSKIIESEGLKENGVKEGLWVFYKSSGNFLKTETYSKGSLNGPYQEFKSYSFFLEQPKKAKDRLKIIEERPYTISLKGEFANNEKTGTWERIENNYTKEITNYQNNKMNGLHIINNYSGKPSEIITYQNDIKNGKYYKFGAKGDTIEKGNYLKGYKWGTWEFFNGDYRVTHKIQTFENDTLNGPFKTYIYNYKTKDKELAKEAFYKKGKLDGIYTQYMYGESESNIYDKKWKVVSFYVDGLKQGESIKYNENNVIIEKDIFKDDYLQESSTFFPSGVLRTKTFYIRDRKSGKEIENYETGNILQEINYKNGKRFGAYKKYYPNGILKYEANFEEFGINGLAVTYNEKGKKILEEKYELGSLTDIYHYDENNRMTHEKPEVIEPMAEISTAEISDYAEKRNENEPLTYVEKMPEFPGGQEQLMNYLQKNIHYPEMAREMGIQGKVFVEFVIDTEGSVTNVLLKRGVHKTLDEEALRVIRSMPKWSPGTQQGKTVKVRMILPIAFKLQ